MKALVVAALLALSGCAATLRRAADMAEGFGQASLLCDAASTHRGVAIGRIEENPLLGPHPTDLALWHYFGAVGVVDFLANRVVEAALREHPMAAAAIRLVGNLGLATMEFNTAARTNAWGTLRPCGV